jgi:signal recognition particle subunit SRP54
MFDELSRKLDGVLKKLRGQGKVSPENVAQTLREVRRILLDADVNYRVARTFIDRVMERAVGQEVMQSITPGQLIVKIIHDELVELLGTEHEEIHFSESPPTVILVAGLQGSGKTTFCAKLALHLHGQGRHPLLAAADVHRPAAVDQLVTLGSSLHIPVYSESGSDAVTVGAHALDHARKNARDTLIIDTAGRLHVDEEMMQEVEAIMRTTSPHEILFVVDAMTGQDAVNTAKVFHKRLQFHGAVLTKMDGDSRGGAALSLRATVGVPIKFVGVGENPEALERFHPERMASRILGMGDVITLVEKAAERLDGEKAVRLEEKLRRATFTLEDFLEQILEMRNMGPLDQLVGMIPGMHKLPEGATVDERALTRVEAIIRSMTLEERHRPHIINGSRRKRIAQGSGTSVQDVNRLMKQYDQMQKMMKAVTKKGKSGRRFRGMQLPVGF